MSEPTRALLTRARRYVRTADLARADGDYNSAASRLYYAMLYCAQALLLTRRLTYSSHRGVLSAFGQHFARTGELPPETHRWLLDAFGKRQVGDYFGPAEVTESDVEDLRVQTEQFIVLTEAYLRQIGAIN